MLDSLGQLADAILEIANNAMSSPWIYVVMMAIAAIDSVLPVVPAETLVITAGVFAASGPPSLGLVIIFASAGAYIGDHMAYGIGRLAGTRLYERATPGSKRHAGFRWAHQQLQERGGLILVICRQIPGGRTAVTLTAGTVRYPLRKFSFFEIFAALSWGVYAALIGYFGGVTFGEDPLKGLALGFSIAISVSIIVEVTRFWIRRRRLRALERDAAIAASTGMDARTGGEADAAARGVTSETGVDSTDGSATEATEATEGVTPVHRNAPVDRDTPGVDRDTPPSDTAAPSDAMASGSAPVDRRATDADPPG